MSNYCILRLLIVCTVIVITGICKRNNVDELCSRIANGRVLEYINLALILKSEGNFLTKQICK